MQSKLIVLIIGLLFIFSQNPGYAQNIYEDSKGAGAIQLFDEKVSILLINTLDKKLELNYGKYSSFKNKLFSYVFEISGKARNSTSSIVNTGDIVPQANFKLRIGSNLNSLELKEYQPTKLAKRLWLFIDFGLGISKFNLFDPDTVFENQVNDSVFLGYEVNLGFNYWHANLQGARLIGGVSIGIKSDNNLNELSEKSLEEESFFNDSETEQLRIVKEAKTVYEGKYRESTSWPIGLDLILAPQFLQSIAINYHFRVTPNTNKNTESNMAIGFFILKNNNPLNPFGGISLGLIDFKINLLMKIDLPLI